MSIEPTCEFCGLVDKSRCKTADQADDCPHAPVDGKAAVIATGPLRGLVRQNYGAILADPPWSFLTRSDKGKDRSPEQHYDCMTLDEIMGLPVGELAAKNCALFMWTIDTHLPMALRVIEEWGFTYKTVAFTWAKLNRGYPEYSPEDQAAASDKAWFKGMGFWTRANPEMCLLATRGAPQRQSKAVRRLIVDPVREHSRKPDETYRRVEELVGGPYVELFSRSSRRGWDMMGNQVGKFAGPESDDYAARAIAELI